LHLLLVALCYFICLQINRLIFSYSRAHAVKTVVLGAPIFRNFDINQVFQFYYCELVAVPLAAWVLYVQLGSLLGWKASAPQTAPVDPGNPSVLGDAGRLAVVGAFLSRFFPPVEGHFWAGVVVCAGTYAVAVAALSWVLGRCTRRSARDWRATLNVLALPFTVLALASLSARASAVLDGQVVAVPWLPVGLGAFAFWVLWMVCVCALWSKRLPLVGSALRAREKSLLLSVGCSLFLFLPTVAGAPIVADLFHLGESIVPPTILLNGGVPWRDFLFVHGLMEDVVRALPGMLHWGGIWGASNGQTVWLLPVGMATLGLLYQRLIRGNTAALLLVLLLVLAPLKQVGFALHQRFLLVPLTLFACVSFYTRPSIWRAAVFACLSVLALFTTAETFFFALAFAATTIIADIQAKQMRRTLLYGGFSIAFVLIGFGILASQGALGAFLDFHLNTASGHRFSGGLPIPALEATFFLLNLLCVAAAILYGLACWRRKQALTPEELAVGAVAIFAIVYYQKFLSRADVPHFMIYWVPVTPLLYYCLARVLNTLDAAYPAAIRRRVSHPLSIALLLVVLGLRWPQITGALSTVDARPVLQTNDIDPELGPFQSGPGIRESTEEVRAFFASRKYDGPLFDFANQPLLFHYLLGLPPATRFPYVSLAIHPYLQTQLVRELEAARPRFAIYAKGPHNPMLGSWDDVHNMVRHYQVSRQVLDNYVPVAWVAEHLVMERSDLAKTHLPGSTYRSLSPCEWGSILANWSEPYTTPPPGAAVRTTQASGGWRTEIDIPQNLRGRGATLDLFVDESQPGRVTIQTPGGGIGWKMHEAKKRRYRMLLGSCPQWHSVDSPTFVLQHASPMRVESVRWIAEPVKGFEH
jgi:hypothetical protein